MTQQNIKPEFVDSLYKAAEAFSILCNVDLPGEGVNEQGRPREKNDEALKAAREAQLAGLAAIQRVFASIN